MLESSAKTGGAPVRRLALLPDESDWPCEVRDGVVYRTNFVVQGDGRVADIRPEPAPACFRAAFAEWLRTVQYAPPGKAVPTTIDWMFIACQLTMWRHRFELRRD